jgi:hypothetical protein
MIGVDGYTREFRGKYEQKGYLPPHVREQQRNQSLEDRRDPYSPYAKPWEKTLAEYRKNVIGGGRRLSPKEYTDIPFSTDIYKIAKNIVNNQERPNYLCREKNSNNYSDT